MLIIRDAVRSDMEAVYSMIGARAGKFADAGGPQEAKSNAKNLEKLIFDDNGARCIVGEEDGEVVAYVFYFYSASSLHCMRSIMIKNLYVREDRRRRGTGSALLKYMENKAVEEGTVGLEWYARTKDPGNEAFYAANGIEPSGVRIQYHWDTGIEPAKN